MLAERNGVLNRLLPIFDFVPGDQSPPPAPKHATAVSKPKVPRQAGGRQAPRAKQQMYAQQVMAQPQQLHTINEAYEMESFRHEGTPDHASIMISEDGDPSMLGSQYSSKKRKRGMEAPPQMSFSEQEHLLWTDELLDYFMLQNSNEPLPQPPEPPQTIDLNRPVDDKGHTPMHWAAAMGDLHVVSTLEQRGARLDCQAHNGETPLMRAVMFTNNWDKQTMDRLVDRLQGTADMSDWFGSTVFHHIAATTCSKSKYQCARYYLDILLTKLGETWPPEMLTALLEKGDHNGDTAIILAARYGARKCVRSLLNHGVNIETPNARGETADELIKELNARRRDRYRAGSSSPPARSNVSPSNIRSSPTIMPTTISPSRQRSRDVLHYRSEAATMLASQLPTLITSRAEALAAAFESELAEREVEAHEAERLLDQRRQEMQVLHNRNQALRARFGDTSIEDTTYDDEQLAELDALTRESERLLELEQAAELHRAVQDAEAALPTTSSTSPSDATGDLTEKLHLAHALAASQSRRRALVSSVVAASSLASPASSLDNTRFDMYKLSLIHI